MGKQGKRILAILAILALVCALFAGCKKDTPTDATTTEPGTLSEDISSTLAEPDYSGDETQPDDSTGEEPSSEDVTGTEAGETGTEAVTATGTGTETGTAAEVTTAEEATKALIYRTDAEKLEYINAALNKVKTEKAGFTWRERTVIDKDKIWVSSGIINAVVPVALGIAGKYLEWTETRTVAKGADHNRFPVEGQPWSSKLTMADVKSVSITDGGSVYNVKIVLKDEDFPVLPTDRTKTMHGKAMNIWNKDDIDDGLKDFESVVGIDKFSPKYSGSYISGTIDKATGSVKKMTYYSNAILTLHVNKIAFKVDINATIPVALEQEYVF